MKPRRKFEANRKSRQCARARVENQLRARFESHFEDSQTDEELVSTLARMRGQVLRSSDPEQRKLSVAAALYLLFTWLYQQPAPALVVCFIDQEKQAKELDKRVFAYGLEHIYHCAAPVDDIDRLYFETLR